MRLTQRYSVIVGTAGAILAGTALVGCKDFLTNNAVPQGTLDQGTLATANGVEGTLIAAYRSLDCNYNTSAWGCAVSNWAFGSVASDDAYKGSTPDDQPGAEQIELYQWSGPDAQGYLNGKWSAMYDGVARANATLRQLKLVTTGNASAMSAADVAGIRGEAMFLRAHYEFEAYRMWGNVPYYRETDTDFKKPNEDKKAVEADLLRDLDSAITLLPEKPRNGQKGRATKWTATAYKGRVQMYAGDYAGALTTFRAVQASKMYGLSQSFDQLFSGYQADENGPETIFAYQASANDGNPDGENANFGETLNFPVGSSGTCCGFHNPSQNLVNFFRVDGNGLPLALSSPGSWNSFDGNFDASQTAAVDPRLDWTAGRDNVPYKDWGLHVKGWIRDPSTNGFYSPKKNIAIRASGAASKVGWNAAELNSENVYIYRYADMLLMLAEAEVEVGSLENARIIVDSVRARAARTVQGCGVTADNAKDITALYPSCAGDARVAVPLGDPSVQWANYKIGQYTTPWTDKAAARAAVRAERRLELAMEGQRFFDLRRWQIADSVINGYINGVGGGAEKNREPTLASALPFTSRDYLYPIPDQQIQLSQVNGASALKQNPGW